MIDHLDLDYQNDICEMSAEDWSRLTLFVSKLIHKFEEKERWKLKKLKS